MKTTKETKLSEILEKGGEKILAKYNVPCLTCPFAQQEMNKLSIGQIAELYDLDLEGLLKELNEL